jgi:hypothetical protein
MEKLLGCGPGLLISCSVVPDHPPVLPTPSQDTLSREGSFGEGEGILSAPDPPTGLFSRCPEEERRLNPLLRWPLLPP